MFFQFSWSQEKCQHSDLGWANSPARGTINTQSGSNLWVSSTKGTSIGGESPDSNIPWNLNASFTFQWVFPIALGLSWKTLVQCMHTVMKDSQSAHTWRSLMSHSCRDWWHTVGEVRRLCIGMCGSERKRDGRRRLTFLRLTDYIN